MLDRHIFIIGMPGSGKSSLSKRVSNEMGIPYVDMDQRIAQLVGCSVTEIFEKYGEQAFRNAETNCLGLLIGQRPSIVSTGGGTIMRDVNRQIMRNHGVIIFIDRPLEEIKSDIKLDRRPLLAKKGLEELDHLYHERIDVYRAAADYVLLNDQGYYNGVFQLERLISSIFAL
ncbi:MAG: shikimate kinase [bacterium]|nr:shikimate kinase [bacterium]